MGLLLTITEPRATAACIYVASLACPRRQLPHQQLTQVDAWPGPSLAAACNQQ